MTSCGLHVVFTVNADWVFRIHFLPLAQLLTRQGFQVTIMARDTGEGAAIERRGMHFIHWPVTRSGKNPVMETAAVLHLLRHYRRMKPDLVHHIGLKAICYGSVASRLLRLPAVHMFIGLGFAFRNQAGRSSRLFLKPWLRTLRGDKRSVLVFQNAADRAYGQSQGWGKEEKTYVVGGVGVDLSGFREQPEPQAPPFVVVFASRMLWDKGVGEFVEAARILKKEWGELVQFVLVGGHDAENPCAVPRSCLEGWHREGVVDWLGFRHDIPQILAMSHLVVLPSYYGEGVPKILLEAAAVGRAAVTTDWPGCRDAVLDGVTGRLVPPKDPRALARAIDHLLSNRELRSKMGHRARERAEKEFSVVRFSQKILRVYRDVLSISRKDFPLTGNPMQDVFI
ncbi:glycosyltransferase family 4 protein [Desulfosoma caldarium]|uniref:Glycosyltransferase involved in cell wall biosynthesis n=1 Tax=Desulfosoma caldarium TaxID=610254 RepID=A0A3N1VTK8_9BACT|nr:glycosyltransferase family 4 protein [Desulfosoma caldarium]ROR03127.1 glycosyltransferase involved in cell wall biosynthesis [Desulfosoma caldarium]